MPAQSDSRPRRPVSRAVLLGVALLVLLALAVIGYLRGDSRLRGLLEQEDPRVPAQRLLDRLRR